MSISLAPAPRPMCAAEWALLVALAAMWGGSFFFNGVAIRELPVLTVVATRVALAALLLLIVLLATGQALPRSSKIWLSFLGMGMLNNVLPFALIIGGQRHVGSAAASILNAATPLFTVLLAHVLTDSEKITVGKAIGVLIGFAGVAAMIGANPLGAGEGAVTGQLMCLGGALSYALAGLFGRRFVRMGVAPMATATGQLIASSLILLPIALAIDRPWTLFPPGVSTMGALLGLAAISTALAYVVYFRLLATAGATNLLLVTFLVPIGAISLGIAFLGETLLPRHVTGMALIQCGLLAVDGRTIGWLRARFLVSQAC